MAHTVKTEKRSSDMPGLEPTCESKKQNVRTKNQRSASDNTVWKTSLRATYQGIMRMIKMDGGEDFNKYHTAVVGRDWGAQKAF